MNLEVTRSTSCSFIIARDPSIISYNRGRCIAGLDAVKMNLETQLTEDSSNDSDNQFDDGGMKIFLRLKKISEDFTNHYTITDTEIQCKAPEDSQYAKTTQRGEPILTQYQFSKIFGPTARQSEIFNYIMKPKVLEFINGENSSVMMFGASNSGKTFTTVGNPHEPGLIPRSLEYLFNSLQEIAQNPHYKPLPYGEISRLDSTQSKLEINQSRNLIKSMSVSDLNTHINTYKAMQKRLSFEPASATVSRSSPVHIEVWVSYVEIYNEQIYDLLVKPPERGQQRKRLHLGRFNGHSYVKDLTSLFVGSSVDAYKVLQYGLDNLKYASTLINSHSSRSHSIFTVKLLQVSDGGTQVNNLNFCDLAGHERSKRTQNVGDQLKESCNINGSLMVLGRCIQAVRNVQKGANVMVPYRDSKLTQLFQEALGGKEDIAMVINLNPAPSVFDESQHVLSFSAIAKNIKIAEKKDVKNNRFSLYLSKNNNTRESELEEMVEENKNIIEELQREMEGQRIDYEDLLKTERDRLITEYDELLKLCQEQHDTKVKRMQAELRRANAREKELQMRLDSHIERQHVINLDSSSDSDSDSEECNRDSQSILINKLRNEVEELKQENDRLKCQNSELAKTL